MVLWYYEKSHRFILILKLSKLNEDTSPSTTLEELKSRTKFWHEHFLTLVYDSAFYYTPEQKGVDIDVQTI